MPKLLSHTNERFYLNNHELKYTHSDTEDRKILDFTPWVSLNSSLSSSALEVKHALVWVFCSQGRRGQRRWPWRLPWFLTRYWLDGVCAEEAGNDSLPRDVEESKKFTSTGQSIFSHSNTTITNTTRLQEAVLLYTLFEHLWARLRTWFSRARKSRFLLDIDWNSAHRADHFASLIFLGILGWSPFHLLTMPNRN